MRILIEAPKPGEEDTVIIKYHDIPTDLIDLLRNFKSSTGLLVGYKNNQTHKMSTTDIYYIDSVDNKTFAYCTKDVYELKEKLYEVEELNLKEFLRISKSTIVNIKKVEYIKPALAGRFEATLSNNEKVIVSRSYVKELKKAFGV